VHETYADGTQFPAEAHRHNPVSTPGSIAPMSGPVRVADDANELPDSFAADSDDDFEDEISDDDLPMLPTESYRSVWEAILAHL
jgi:hypothetical protein